jgi:hypothetical protein
MRNGGRAVFAKTKNIVIAQARSKHSVRAYPVRSQKLDYALVSSLERDPLLKERLWL